MRSKTETTENVLFTCLLDASRLMMSASGPRAYYDGFYRGGNALAASGKA
jgi:hypothetical protein